LIFGRVSGFISVLVPSDVYRRGSMLDNGFHEEEVKLLRSRSLRMLVHAEECLRSRDYDLAAFLAEQSVQLYLKSVILELVGEVPRTHSIRQLLHMIRTILDKEMAERIDEFVHSHRRLLTGLEEAYLASRYLFRIYEKDESEELVRFAKEVIRFVENLKVKT